MNNAVIITVISLIANQYTVKHQTLLIGRTRVVRYEMRGRDALTVNLNVMVVSSRMNVNSTRCSGCRQRTEYVVNTRLLM